MKIKYLILVFISIATFSQQKGDVSLVWSQKSGIYYGNDEYNIPHFKSENFNFDNSKKSINYHFKKCKKNGKA